MIEREHVGINQIVRMDKLERTVTTANHINIASLAKPFEQDLENSQTAFAQDRARPDDNQPQPGFLTNLPQRLFAGEFVAPLNFDSAQRLCFRNRVSLRE